MTDDDLDPLFLAAVLHAARFGSRREARDLLHRAGLPSKSADLDAVLAAIDARPDRADIAALAGKIEAEREDPAAALRLGPKWVIGETTDGSRHEFVLHNRHPRFLARVLDVDDWESEGIDPFITDPGDPDTGLAPPVWLDDVSKLDDTVVRSVLLAAFREIELYGQQFDDD
jgi:hypothetical protein